MLHSDSQILQRFMNPIVKEYNKNREKKPFLSKVSQIFIEKILGWMEDAEESFSFSKTTILETDLDKEDGIVKGTRHHHIPHEVNDYIERMDWIGKKLEFSIGIRTFNIYLVHPIDINNSKTQILEWFNEIKKMIYCWLYIASMQSTKGCSKKLDIYLYFTDFKKEFPKDRNDILGDMNVNTAYTFSCSLSDSGNNEMYIYRKEEWFKVFIHESFHSFALDFSNMSRDFSDKQILKIFPLHIDLRFYETYTEMWAEVINIIYIVYSSKIKNKIVKVTEYLKMEQLFSLFQALKILKYNHISYVELYEMTESAKMKRIHNYKENTPVMAYYILKSICMMNVGEFIEWTTVSNKGSLNFRKTESYLLSFINFIKERYNRSDFLKALEFIEGYYSTLLKRKLLDGFYDVLNSLRMSMFTPMKI